MIRTNPACLSDLPAGKAGHPLCGWSLIGLFGSFPSPCILGSLSTPPSYCVAPDEKIGFKISTVAPITSCPFIIWHFASPIRPPITCPRARKRLIHPIKSHRTPHHRRKQHLDFPHARDGSKSPAWDSPDSSVYAGPDRLHNPLPIWMVEFA